MWRGGGEERKKGVDGGVRAPTLLSTEQPRMWMHRQSLSQPEESVSRMNFLLIARNAFVGVGGANYISARVERS